MKRSLLLLAAVLIAIVLGLWVGTVPMAPGRVWRGLVDSAAPESVILRQLRVPRVLLAFLVGGGLGVTGAVLQALVRNPLADPYLLGLSGGAGLGAVVAMAMHWGGPWAVPVAAFIGAAAAVALVYRLALVAGNRLDPRILLLGGVVVGSFAAAVMTAIITMSPAEDLRNAFLWLLGGFGAASWQKVALFAAYATVPILILFSRARMLDLLLLGEEPARYLGADVERTKRVVYVTASILTAVSVSVCGIIGFVGLVIPHMMRRLGATLHRPLLPAAFAGGGAFLVLADTLARSVVRPFELPVGVVTALVGVPLFAVLLRRSVR